MNYSSEDTIAGISTAIGRSGIGIIRISGPDAIRAADIVFRPSKGVKKLSEAASHTIHYGYITDADGSVADEVLVSVMRAPRTYTAEDTVEINCHGGAYVIRRVLDIVLGCRARSGQDGRIVNIRAAQPGEFTKRAFLNGRIDLSQAEAVMDLIESKNDFALRNSIGQVKGSLYEKISSLRSSILYQTAHIEASLDDPENMDFTEHTGELEVCVNDWICELKRLSDSFDNGRMAAEGIKTVILGKPNAGKSSFMNLLVGDDRAIVTDIAGTTRDTLTETVMTDGITLLLTDTAGIRDTSDKVEMIGVERARQSASDADLVLWIVDSSVSVDNNDMSIVPLLEGKKTIVILNKSDLDTVTDAGAVNSLLSEYHICGKNGKDTPVVSFSAANGNGFDMFIAELRKMFFGGEISWNDEVIITNARQKALLDKAGESLERVQESINADMSEDFFSIDLMDAYEALGAITGDEIDDDLADEIFSRFCMGK